MAIGWTRDEIILACDLVSINNWRGLRASEQPVKELSTLLRQVPIHPIEERDEAFRSPNSVQRKTFDIATQHPDYRGKPTKGSNLDRAVLAEFLAEPDRMRAVALAIRSAVESGSLHPPLVEEIQASEMEASEGALLLSQHLSRERDPRLRRAKLKEVARDGRRLCCEVCLFEFGRVYGTLGEGYIEVHHRLPLHTSGLRVTRL